jgi:hypothetical protein
VVALESIVARRRMVALNKEIADLTSRVSQLESAEQRRLVLESRQRGQPKPSSPPAGPPGNLEVVEIGDRGG